MNGDGTSRREFLKATGGAVLGSGLLYGSSRSTLAQSKESWPQFGYDDANSRHAPQNSGLIANIQRKWRFETNNYVISSPAVEEGSVYIGSYDTNVYALHASDGSEEWRFETGDSVDSSPAVVDGTVYIGSADGNVYALNAEEGTEEWRFETGDVVFSSPTVEDGTVFVGSQDHNVYALNEGDGSEQWRFETNGSVDSSPAVVDGTVFFGSDDNNVYALDAGDGSEQWHFETDSYVNSSPAVVDQVVYVGSDDNSVYALNAREGTEEWRFETDGVVFSSPAVADGTVFVGSHDANVYALNAVDGSEQWHFETADVVDSSPAVVGGTVYVGSDDNNVYALDAGDGSEKGRFNTDLGANSSPAVVDGTVYVGSTDGNTYALIGSDGSGGEDNLSVLPIILATLGVGGVGAWWYGNRAGTNTGEDSPSESGSTGDTDGSSSAIIPSSGDSTGEASGSESGPSTGHTATARSGTTSTSSETDSKASSDSGLLESTNKSLDKGDSLRDEASGHRDAGRYHRALDTLDKSQHAYKNALETANQSEFIDTDVIEQKFTAVKDGRKETQRQQLQAEVNSLWSDLDHADTLADEGDVEGAQEGLGDLESSLTSAKETAAQHGFDDLREEIGTLERECEERLMEVLEQLQAYPIPDGIPRAPDVSVDYNALTDEESIGAGGTSDVTKATLSTATGDVQLAIKRPRMAGTLHTDAVESLLEEAETWDKIDDHDHIVGVVDYGSQPVPWIAMEYMDAGHLGEHAGQMEMPQALWTALNVTEGIYYAHRRGIAHLDLKPENILFRTVEDSWDVPKVADWGLAKHLLEHSKSVEGMSINYAAPEQFDDEYGQTDDITDVYQLGAVLYKLFTGRPPFRGQPFKVVNMVKTDRPTPPSEIAEVPEGLDDILLTALAKEKDNRYDDIVYLRDDLQELFDNLKRSVR